MADLPSSNQASEDSNIAVKKIKLEPNVSENAVDFSKLTIEWKANIFNIEIKMKDNLVNLKHLIYTALQGDLFCDLFSNILLPENLKEDDLASQKQEWKSSGVELQLTVIHNQNLSDLDKPSSVFYVNKLADPHHIYRFPRVNQAPHFKVLNKPRARTSRLVILDIDQTIYDIRGAGTPLSGRPFLNQFLEGLYKYYEIGLWSNTSMEVIEVKLDELGILNNSMYKILFYAGSHMLVSHRRGNEIIRVKSLEVVWMKFPKFNETNTLLCDDRIDNFALDKRNGIPVKPYYYGSHDTDEELLQLFDYLCWIVKYSNLTLLDNRRWKKYLSLEDDNSSEEL